ncbi:hypothetical protein [Streptomyces albipurpureus]|uniref:Uncharacterized protein n=1 Tax=Streptomyces albipurpureus TaxID=2897419 RepID=A0ABT0UT77_9ACTN|nr:hypothetical protein [Streptomyces sp. CWNU-1]MCM2391758.1 hypothetical protein [Streptomyces sp. CWNU-1]
MPRASLPALDAYDLQGVRSDEAALWGDDVRMLIDSATDWEYLVDALDLVDEFV